LVLRTCAKLIYLVYTCSHDRALLCLLNNIVLDLHLFTSVPCDNGIRSIYTSRTNCMVFLSQ